MSLPENTSFSPFERLYIKYRVRLKTKQRTHDRNRGEDGWTKYITEAEIALLQEFMSDIKYNLTDDFMAFCEQADQLGK